MDLGLAGKKAMVTGGSRGIGLAIAQTLIDEGATVAICARGEEGVNAAVAQLGANALGSAVDVADIDGYTTWLTQTAEELGGLDIFVGNIALAGGESDDEIWRTSYEVDLMHCVRGCRTLLPTLAESECGSVVLVSSVSSIMSELPPEEMSYAAMKAALVSYGSQLSQAAAADGTRVNMVSPGPVFFEGGVWDQVKAEDPEMFEFASGLPALGRMGTPDEIARTVTFLASPASSFTTGANLRIDGGTVKSVQH